MAHRAHGAGMNKKILENATSGLIVLGLSALIGFLWNVDNRLCRIEFVLGIVPAHVAMGD